MNIEAMKQALEALERAASHLRTAIAEAEKQEPVAWPCHMIEADFSERTVTLGMECGDYKVGAGQHWLHTTPPAAQRQPLTEAEIADVWDKQLFDITDMSLAIDFVRDIEAAHGITGEKT
jgi:hypothetical protein